MAINLNEDLADQIKLPTVELSLDIPAGIACAEDALMAGLNDAIAGVNDAIEEATADIDAAIDDVIGDIESKISEAEDALNAALGDVNRELRTLQGDVLELLELVKNPLNIAIIPEKLRELEEFYGDAVEDIQEVIGKVTALIEDPLAALSNICDELPNVEEGPNGKPIEKEKESKEPSASTEIEIGLPTRPKVTTRRETLDESADSIKKYSNKIPADGALANNIGLSDGQVSSLAAAMLARESSGDYTVINQYGYAGGYQFGASALETIGYLKPGTSKSGNRTAMRNPNNWTGKNGLRSLDDFLNNPSAQDLAFQENLAFNARALRRRGVLGPDSTPEEIAGYLSASHLLGASGAAGSLNATDANGTTGREYYALGSGAMGDVTVAQERPNTRPAETGSGSVTVADLTTGATAFPYPAPTRGSNVWDESADQINRNLQNLADLVMSPIKDEFPDLVITHGMRSEYVEYKGGRYVTRTRVGNSSDHYRGCACDFTFSNVTSKQQLIERANKIREIVPEFRQFLLEYPRSFDNNNYLLHIAYRVNDNKNQVITFMGGGQKRYGEFV